MADLSNPSGGGGYDYVQSSTPSDASEGDEWYDTSADVPKTYDGTSWVSTKIESHNNLTNVSSGDHHSRYTDSEARNAAFNIFASGSVTIASNNNVSISGSVPTSEYYFAYYTDSYDHKRHVDIYLREFHGSGLYIEDNLSNGTDPTVHYKVIIPQT